MKCNYVGGQHSWKTKLEMGTQVIKAIKTPGGVETELTVFIFGMHTVAENSYRQ